MGLRLESPTITRSVADSGDWSASARRLRRSIRWAISVRVISRSRVRFDGVKKFSSAALDPLGRVDLAGVEPLDQVFDRDVDVDDLVGLGQHAVGDALLDLHVRCPLDLVVEALQMLDVHRGDDVDPAWSRSSTSW